MITSKKAATFFALLALVLFANLTSAAIFSNSSNPSIVSDSNLTGGAGLWISPQNASTLDGQYAQATLNPGLATGGEPQNRSHYLLSTNYNFSIPALAIIKGIQVNVTKACDKNSGCVDFKVQLIKNGAIQSTDKAQNITYTKAPTFTNSQYGNSMDLWSSNWTPADINAANFGFAFSSQQGSSTADFFVDSIKITIFWEIDTENPNLTVPSSPVIVNATSSSGATVNFSNLVNATDNSGSANISCSPASGSLFSFGNTTVQCTATDAAGNNNSKNFTVTVVDQVAPVVNVPNNITAEATSNAGAEIFFTVNATDNFDGPISASCNYQSGYTFALGTTQITCNSTDSQNNFAEKQFSITVQDTTAPSLDLNGNNPLFLEVFSSYTELGAIASDLVQGDLSSFISIDNSALNTNLLGAYNIIYSINDSYNNLNQTNRTVIVRDTTLPVITLIGNQFLSLEVFSVYSDEGANATDNYDVDISANIVTNNTLNSSELGNYTVTYDVNDSSNNSAIQVTRTVSIVDTTSPALNMPSNILTEATGALTEVNFTVSATDNYDQALTILCNNTSNSYSLGTTVVECNTTDSSNNTASSNFAITVQDTTTPVINNSENLTAEATFELGTNVSYNISAQDNIDGNLIVSCSQESGSLFSLGETIVSCNTTDNSGNTAYSEFSITVRDTTAPILSLPATIIAEATDENGAIINFTVNATDIVDQDVSISCNYSSGDLFAIGTTEVECVATDDANNNVTGSFNVQVLDTTKPTIFLIGNQTIIIELGENYTEFGANATDSVDGNLTSQIIIDNSSLNVTEIGTYTVTYNVNDSENNSADQINRTVIVQDTTAPEITNNSENPVVIELGNSFVEPTVNVTDNSGSYTLTNSSNVNESQVGTYTFNFTANDSGGNSAEYSYTIIVQDTNLPNLTILGDNPLFLEVFSNYSEFGANATDNSGDLTSLIIISGQVNTSILGNYTVIYSITDESNNSVNATRTVIVRDTTLPVITLNGNSTITLTAGLNYSEFGANATDNYDGDISANIIIDSSALNILVPGAYNITYNANDSSNNSATQVVRTVNVVAAPLPPRSGGGGSGNTRVNNTNTTSNLTTVNQTIAGNNIEDSNPTANESGYFNQIPITGAVIGGGKVIAWLALLVIILVLLAYLYVRYRKQINGFFQNLFSKK